MFKNKKSKKTIGFFKNRPSWLTKKKKERTKKAFLKWCLSIFMFIAVFAGGLSLASPFFAFLGMYFLPVASVQSFITKYLPKKKKARFALVIVIFLVACCLVPQIETTPAKGPNHEGVSTPAPTPHSTPESTPEATPAPTPTSTPEPTPEPTPIPTPEATPSPSDSTFTVHFIDVGQADAALILCDGQAMLIDGGNAEDSNLMYTYLKKQGVTHLNYVIGTHAHEDHIGGIAGALNYASAGTVYCPVTDYDTKAFQNFKKAAQKHGCSLTVPTAGDAFSLGSANCEILAVNTQEDTNNTSIVLRITYGETSFLFTGDAEREVELALLDSNTKLQSTVLKVGHHGSESSTSYAFLREVAPAYAVISVGKDNTYGHPTEEVLSRLRDADVKTYRTDLQGDVICSSDGKTVNFTTDKNTDADVFAPVGPNSTQATPEPTPKPTPAPTPKPTEKVTYDYVLNTNTKKFHYSYCSSAKQIKDANRKNFTGTREAVIAQGYVACKKCSP